MSVRRLTILLIAALAIIGASYGWSALQQAPAAAVETETVTLALDRSAESSNKSADELITFWQSRVERAPQDYISMTYLGQAYLNKARETADASNYTRAEAAFNEALKINPTYTAATAFLGSVLFSQHEFAQALALSQEVYAQDPKALLSLALIGDAQLELGQYEAAQATYETLQAQVDTPPVTSRMARLAWLNGEPETAVSLMQQAADAATESGLTGESVAWYQFQLGELYFNTGQLPQAIQQYQLSLNAFPNYYLGLAGMGKAAAAQGDLNTAIELYEQVVARTPQPSFVAYLGDLYAAAGDQTKAQQQYETVTFLAQLEAQNGILYNRQLALYYADHDIELEQALTIAEAELAQRQDIHAYDTLAWALYKNGRFAEAANAMENALALGTQEATLFYHAGMIYEALGQTDKANSFLNQALTMNPYFDLMQTAVAQQILANNES